MKNEWSVSNLPAVTLLIVGLGVGGGLGWWAGQREGVNKHELSSQGVEKKIRDGNGARDGRGSFADTKKAGTQGFSKGGSKDFAQSVRAIFRETIPARRVAMFENMLEKTSVANYPELVALIRANDLNGSGSNEEWSKLWASWGERDPVDAMEFIRQHNWTEWDSSAPSEAGKRTMLSWAQADPAAAKRFAVEGEELAKGDRSLLFSMVEGWSYVDPTAAADWLMESGLGLGGEYLAVVESISRRGGQQAVEDWFAGLDQTKVSPKDINGFAEKIAGKKQEHEPEKAAAWVEANLDAAWVRESNAVPETAAAYVRRDPLAAVAWARRTGLPNAVAATMASWCYQDLNAVKKWTVENPTAPEFATSAAMVMSFLKASDPAAARSWAEALPDRAMGDRLLGQPSR